MFLEAGAGALIRQKNIVGIFDLDTSTLEESTRKFLSLAERQGHVTIAGEELPKAFVLLSPKDKDANNHESIVFSRFSSGVLAKRCEIGGFYDERKTE
ncbi:MAG: DUF370 domain-containing protein [Clostridia bacterium]|nr:DUF370 domain-containing protein [Clostridia bacterium]